MAVLVEDQPGHGRLDHHRVEGDGAASGGQRDGAGVTWQRVESAERSQQAGSGRVALLPYLAGVDGAQLSVRGGDDEPTGARSLVDDRQHETAVVARQVDADRSPAGTST